MWGSMRAPSRRRLLHTAVGGVVWLALSALAALVLFLGSSTEVTLASHDAHLRPTLTWSGPGEVVVRTGPVLPDVRMPAPGRIGVEITLGKTDATTTAALVKRYAVLAGAPEGQIAKVRAAITGLAISAVLRGLVIGAIPLLVWLLVGRARRHELVRRVRRPEGMVVLAAVAGLVIGVWQPGTGHDEEQVASDWMALPDFLGSDVPIPGELSDVQVRGDITTATTRRLIESAISTYDSSKVFYNTAAESAADLDLRRPAAGESVAVLVSDRHDNIGMDAVARAVGDAAGATGVLDAGDDTSTGSSWEAFSLDSLDEAFDDYEDRWAIAGNHDHGSFVAGYLADRGWTELDGEVVEGPGGSTLTGVADPRSSGLGNWRDETGLSFSEVEQRIADDVCAADERIATLMVHDANLGREALRRGCVDLVVAGHLHLQVGPDRVVGENGQVGWSYTTGTTGGAAYAFALGSKPRREAEISLITYAEGRPIGIQPVRLETNGTFIADAWIPLTYDTRTAQPGQGRRERQADREGQARRERQADRAGRSR